MASSEMSSSSSDIFQGQGFYNDGGNEAAGIPPLQSPVAPSQVPLETDEGMWKKYSAHYEFPLSLLIALGIHLVAVLLVIAFMAIKIHWGEPRPIDDPEIVIIEGPRIAGNDNETVKGGATGDDGQNGRDPFIAPFDPIKLEQPSTTLVNPDETGIIIPPSSTDLNEKQPLLRPGRPKDGKGDGGKSGDNLGPDHGKGAIMGRNIRWNIQLNYDDPDTLLGQLANLQCIMAGRSNSGRYLVFKQLATSQPGQCEEMTTEEFAKWVNASRLLWFMNSDRNTSENFVYAVNRNDRLLSLYMIIPLDMEKAILAAELKYHKMTEDQVRTKKLRTSFRVVRQGSNYQVEVVKSAVMQ
jgi:hypothetical protein